jgi:hypothetical protein
MKSKVFKFVTPCSLEKAQSFGETFRVHLQGRRVSQVGNQQDQAASFDPEYGGDMILRNVRLSPKYTTLQSRRT